MVVSKSRSLEKYGAVQNGYRMLGEDRIFELGDSSLGGDDGNFYQISSLYRSTCLHNIDILIGAV